MTENAFDIATDLQPIRVEQARVIKAKAKASALIVEISVITYSLLIAASVSPMAGLIWFMAANFMVLVTLIYAKFQAPHGITDENYKAYLFGHTIICALTGLVWGGFAIYIFDLNDPFAFIVAITLPSILTVGGMLPSSAYRPGQNKIIFLPVYSWKSDVFFNNDNDRFDGIVDERQSSYGVLDTKLILHPKAEEWRFEIQVRNITNKNYLLDAGNVGGIFGIPTFIAAPPRTYGVSVSYSF